MKRCNKIAARIMAGDKVPPEDEQYLMTHDSNGYQLAMAMRRVKRDPKEHESELKDEEGGERTEAVSEGGSSAASPESPAEPAPEVPAAPETAPES